MIFKRPCPALALFAACILMPAASGDDLNLLRIALPSAFAQAPVGSFPLDDPNADSLAFPEQHIPQTHLWPLDTIPPATIEGLAAAPNPPATSRREILIAGVIAPLRC
jgi:hypothetical protein